MTGNPPVGQITNETLADFRDRVRCLEADMTKLPLENEVDVVFSTAAFHWVQDHDKLFQSLFRALRPGGGGSRRLGRGGLGLGEGGAWQAAAGHQHGLQRNQHIELAGLRVDFIKVWPGHVQAAVVTRLHDA